ncbi:hypothetical protein C0993_006416 [Termitomyces sp. T159_Od127]|nr:hypothetical protein C0993_006416 [Termitomyces sp. T159_Od127]
MFTGSRNVTINGGHFEVTQHIYDSDPVIHLQRASALNALYSSQDHLPLPEAQSGTVQAVLKWFSSPESKPLLLLHGSSQRVRLAIACALVEKGRERRWFAAGFFFNSFRDNCKSAERLVPTIATQLAENILGFSESLPEFDRRDLSIIQRSPLATQVDQLVIEPLRNLEATVHGPFLIIINALDKCAKEDRREILTQISRIVHAHQGLLRFVVLTSGMERLFNEPEFGSIAFALTIPDGMSTEPSTYREKMDLAAD